MILVIDTSSACKALALIDPEAAEAHQLIVAATDPVPLARRFRELVGPDVRLTKVAVATGPGSFTGLRVGVSFGLGLAIGLRIPIVPLPTLALQAARSAEPSLAVAEAGRGRVYYLAPGGPAAIGEPRDLPTNHEVVGWLRPETERSLIAAGLRFTAQNRLREFSEAAAVVLETAREVPYGSLEIEYMQSFSAPKS
jgi:tRNA A37 threonylcarbamoyladenosine modification protein TsaB